MSPLLAHEQQVLSLPKEQAQQLVLQALPRSEKLAAAIQKTQRALATQLDHPALLERLGKLFISEARLAADESLYLRADACGQLLDGVAKDHPVGLLLRGHSQLALHQFHDAEDLAKRLLLVRQNMEDHALLGDALMEQGYLEQALPAYQAMVDTRPCLPSYSRVAHFRWLKGDLEGAAEMAELAITCGSYRDVEPLAWVTTKLAQYQWQLHRTDLAQSTLERALKLVPDYAPALLLKGRIALGLGQADVATLRKVVQTQSLPESLWALADALELAGERDHAACVRYDLELTGASSDKRSFSLYLATEALLKTGDSTHALELAKAEMQIRRDIHSWDALAWAQHASGQHEAALHSIRKALSEGTVEARLSLHAAIISEVSGDSTLALTHRALAQRMRTQLLPSEQRLLDTLSLAVAAK